MTTMLNKDHSLHKIYEEILSHNISLVCFTACAQKNGTTTIARAIAEIAVSFGQKVLYCDFGFEASSLARTLQVKFIESAQEPIQQIHKNISFIEEFGFDLMTTPLAFLPVLISNNLLSELLRGLISQYDLIIIDSDQFNSTLAESFPTKSLCKIADATILIVMSGEVSEKKLLSTALDINSGGGKLIGCVMNDYNYPRLSFELCREAYRFDRFFPKTMKAIRHCLRKSAFLKIEY